MTYVINRYSNATSPCFLIPMKNLPLLIPCLAIASLAHGATITFDFETPNQFSDNFRVVRGAAGTTIGQTTGLANNYFYGAKPGISPESVVAIYDTTPGNAVDAAQTFGGNFTVDFKVATGNVAQIVGVYLFDGSNPANNLSARLNINATGSSERITFSRDGSSLANGSGGTAYNNTDSTLITGVGGSFSTSNNGWQGSTEITQSSEATPVWYDLTLTYTTSTLTLAWGTSFSATVAIPELDRIANPSLAFYISNYTASSTTKIDDIVITTIPEPSTYGVLLAGLVSGVMAFKRKRHLKQG